MPTTSIDVVRSPRCLDRPHVVPLQPPLRPPFKAERSGGALVITDIQPAKLGALATPVQAQLVEIQWDASDAFERSLMLAPAKFVEVCGKLRKGQSIDWSFTGQSPLNFNIHYHEGKKVVFSAKHDHAESLSGKLTVPADQDYCWMWENKSDASASIALRMRRD